MATHGKGYRKAATQIDRTATYAPLTALRLVQSSASTKFDQTVDVASRLIRDYPELSRGEGDELRVEPKKIWTDIPGQPKGGP